MLVSALARIILYINVFQEHIAFSALVSNHHNAPLQLRHANICELLHFELLLIDYADIREGNTEFLKEEGHLDLYIWFSMIQQLLLRL